MCVVIIITNINPIDSIQGLFDKFVELCNKSVNFLIIILPEVFKYWLP